MKITPTQIDRMKRDRDVKGLVEALAGSANESIRVLAADALGDLRDVESVESLAQAALWDVSEDVRSVAHDALTSILGNQAESVLDSYRANPPEESDDTSSEDEEEDESADKEESGWTDGDLDGLIMVLEGEPNLETKLKAVQALEQIGDTRATQALARATYVDEEPRLQRAARKALGNIFGEDTEEYIESIRLMDLGVTDEVDDKDREEGDTGDYEDEDEKDTEEEDVGDTEEEDENPPAPSYQPSPSVYNRGANQSPVVEWDDPRKRILLPLVIGLIVVAVIIAAVVFIR